MEQGSEKYVRRDRDALSARYAEVISKYQQDHRALMDALRDDSISIETFERMSAQVHEDVNMLKRIKRELRAQRDSITDQAEG